MNNFIIHGAYIGRRNLNTAGDVIRQRAKTNRRQMVKHQVERILQRPATSFSSLNSTTNANSSHFLKSLKEQLAPSFLLQASSPLFHSTDQSDLTQKLQSTFPLCHDDFTWEKMHFQLPENNEKGYKKIASGVLHVFFENREKAQVDLLNIAVQNDADIILDSKNASSMDSNWLTFNVIPGISASDVYTLKVVVRDQKGHILPASQWLSPMNCSDQSTLPIPKTIYNTQDEFYPQLDILTLESSSFQPKNEDGSLMHFPILGQQHQEFESTLSKIEDVSFTENDPLLQDNGKSGGNLPAFQPVNKKIIRNKEEFRDALADLMIVNLNQNLTSELLGVFEDQIMKKKISMS